MAKKHKPKLSAPATCIDELIEISLRMERDALVCVNSTTTSHGHGWAQGFAEGAKRVREKLEKLRGHGMDIC